MRLPQLGASDGASLKSRRLNNVLGHKRGVRGREKRKNKYINKRGQGVINSRRTTTFTHKKKKGGGEGKRYARCEIQCS